MTMVVVFGGGGFFGRRLVHRLTAQGMTVRAAVRHPDHARTELHAFNQRDIAGILAMIRTVGALVGAGAMKLASGSGSIGPWPPQAEGV